MAQAPRNLENLLTSSLKTEIASVDDINQLITDHPWVRKFNQYLLNRELEEETAMLKFLIALFHLEKLTNLRKSAKKTKVIEKLQDQISKLFQEIIYNFFNEEEFMLPLSNSKLQEALCLKKGQTFSEDGFQLLKRAKNDGTVWNEGLEPKYSKFLSTISQDLMACLLSIL